MLTWQLPQLDNALIQFNELQEVYKKYIKTGADKSCKMASSYDGSRDNGEKTT